MTKEQDNAIEAVRKAVTDAKKLGLTDDEIVEEVKRLGTEPDTAFPGMRALSDSTLPDETLSSGEGVLSGEWFKPNK